VLKAVVDTNIFVSGTILSRGNPYQVLEAWRRSQFILVLLPDIIAEIEAVLRRPNIFKKYGLTENLLARLVNTLNAEALVIQPGPIEHLADIKAADLKFLGCAYAGAADYLVAIEPSFNLKPTKPPVSSPLAFSSLSFGLFRAFAE